MMSKFIEVHEKGNGMPISVNVENIVAFENGDIALQTVGVLKITETYDEIKQLILDAGVLIHKADPRLDTTTPLTLEDLKNMIGEPVWNSNALKWGLLTKQDGSYFLLYPTGQMWLFTVNDLIKFPLYRMRQ